MEQLKSGEYVLEMFVGFVHSIEGDVANITLWSEDGDELPGEYPAKELADRGIYDRTKFSLRTIHSGDSVRVELNPVPLKELTSQDMELIRRKTKYLDHLHDS